MSRKLLYTVDQGWPTFHLPCVNFLLYGFRCATISINPGASISLPCCVCLQKQRFVRGCKLRVITTRLQCATSNHAMRHTLATTAVDHVGYLSTEKNRKLRPNLLLMLPATFFKNPGPIPKVPPGPLVNAAVHSCQQCKSVGEECNPPIILRGKGIYF